MDQGYPYDNAQRAWEFGLGLVLGFIILSCLFLA